jgi:hypothetical protein
MTSERVSLVVPQMFGSRGSTFFASYAILVGPLNTGVHSENVATCFELTVRSAHNRSTMGAPGRHSRNEVTAQVQEPFIGPDPRGPVLAEAIVIMKQAMRARHTFAWAAFA